MKLAGSIKLNRKSGSGAPALVAEEDNASLVQCGGRKKLIWTSLIRGETEFSSAGSYPFSSEPTMPPTTPPSVRSRVADGMYCCS